MITYTDAGQLPTAAAVLKLPSLARGKDEDLGSCPQIGSQKSGPDRLSLPLPVPKMGIAGSSGMLMNTGFGLNLTLGVPHSPELGKWCAVQGLNLRLPACEAGALPLS